MIRKLCLFLFLWLLVVSPATAENTPALVINGKEVSQENIFSIMRVIAARQQTSLNKKNQEQIYQQAINDIIASQLSYELALEEDIKNQKAIEQTVQALANESAQNIASYRQQLIIASWQSSQPIPPPQHESWQADYKKFIAKQDAGTLYRIGHIITATEAEALVVIGKLKKNIPFASLVKQHNLSHPSQPTGADIGFTALTRFPPYLATIVPTLKKNEFNNVPIRGDAGFHVIQLLSTKKAGIPSLKNSMPALEQIARQKLVRQKILKRAQKSKIYIIDDKGNKTPITFQPQ